MIPDRSEFDLASLPSQAEARVYRTLRSLPDEVVIVHQLDTLIPGKGSRPAEGEADFLVIDPHHGLLVIEVKGGGVTFDSATDAWHSIPPDNPKKSRPIGNPFKQAQDRKHDIQRYILGHHLWKGAAKSDLPCGHSVIFPHMTEAEHLTGIGRPPEIIALSTDLAHTEEWLHRVYSFWFAGVPGPGGQVCQLVETILCSSVCIQPRLAECFADEEVSRAYWTEEQWRSVRGLRANQQTVIEGGAGTGKTLIGIRWAQEEARNGKRILYLCYNAPLAAFLKRENERFTSENVGIVGSIHPMSYHEFCVWWTGVILSETGDDYFKESEETYPGESESEILRPYSLSLALECRQPDYDTLVVDEAQDFGSEYWSSLRALLRRLKTAVFHDPNQRLYRKAENFPGGAQYALTRNCRNTKHIHAVGVPFYLGPPELEPPPVEGEDVRVVCAESREDQVRAVRMELSKLTGEYGVSPDDIALLLFDSYTKATYWNALSDAKWPSKVRLSFEEHWHPGCVTVDTVKRFKGLEALVVILWINAPIDSDKDRELLYVALSRPRSWLILIGPDRDTRLVNPTLEED